VSSIGEAEQHELSPSTFTVEKLSLLGRSAAQGTVQSTVDAQGPKLAHLVCHNSRVLEACAPRCDGAAHFCMPHLVVPRALL
jgi:hypothetical protein